MALSIPTHSADNPMIFIAADDSAWARGDDVERDINHPVVRYLLGMTRFDLDADGLRDYLDESDGPATYFYLRRLDRHELAEARNHERAGRPANAELGACVAGLRKIENLPGLSFAGVELAPKRPLTDDQAAELESLIGPDILLEIGRAVLRGTAPLTLAEKKR